MIDWSEPELDFVPPRNVVTLRTMDDAIKLLDEWQEAYKELRCEWTRLHSDYVKLKFWAENERALSDNFELLAQMLLAESVAKG